jgi:hypothetical protein
MVPVVTLPSTTIHLLDCGAPNGSPFALPFSEFGWRAFSKNRVKPLLLLDTAQQCVPLEQIMA